MQSAKKNKLAWFLLASYFLYIDLKSIKAIGARSAYVCNMCIYYTRMTLAVLEGMSRRRLLSIYISCSFPLVIHADVKTD